LRRCNGNGLGRRRRSLLLFLARDDRNQDQRESDVPHHFARALGGAGGAAGVAGDATVVGAGMLFRRSIALSCRSFYLSMSFWIRSTSLFLSFVVTAV